MPSLRRNQSKRSLSISTKKYDYASTIGQPASPLESRSFSPYGEGLETCSLKENSRVVEPQITYQRHIDATPIGSDHRHILTRHTPELHRFFNFLAYERKSSPEHRISNEDLLKCPLWGCGEILNTEDEMLQHVYGCAFLWQGLYFCYSCGRTEDIRKLECPRCHGLSARQRLTIALGRLFSKLGVFRGRSVPASRTENHIEGHLSPMGKSCFYDDPAPSYASPRLPTTELELPGSLQANDVQAELDATCIRQELPCYISPTKITDSVSAGYFTNEDTTDFQPIRRRRSDQDRFEDSLYLMPVNDHYDDPVLSQKYHRSLCPPIRTDSEYLNHAQGATPTPYDFGPSMDNYRASPGTSDTTGTLFTQDSAYGSAKAPWSSPATTFTSFSERRSSDPSCFFDGYTHFHSTQEEDLLGFEEPSTLGSNGLATFLDESFDTSKESLNYTFLDTSGPQPSDVTDNGHYPTHQCDTKCLSCDSNTSKFSLSQNFSSSQQLIDNFEYVFKVHFHNTRQKLKNSEAVRSYPMLLSVSTDRVLRDGLLVFRNILHERWPTTIEEVFAWLHFVYACEIIQHQNLTLFDHDMWYQESLCWVACINASPYPALHLQIVSGIWEPKMTDDGFQHKHPMLTSRMPHENLFVKTCQRFLDIWEHLRNRDAYLQLENTFSSPLEAEYLNFAYTVRTRVLNELRQNPELQYYTEAVNEVERRLERGLITSFRNLEVELVSAAGIPWDSESKQSCFLFSTTITGLCNFLYMGIGQPGLRTSCHIEGIDILDRLIAGRHASDVTQLDTSAPRISTDFMRVREKIDLVSPFPFSPDTVRGFDTSAMDLESYDGDVSPLSSIPQLPQLPSPKTATTPSIEKKPSPKSVKIRECPYCPYVPHGKEQWKGGNMKRHIQDKHVNKANFICPYNDCSVPFGRKDNLRHHLRTIHQMNLPRQRRRKSTKSEGAIDAKEIQRLSERPNQKRKMSEP